MRLALLSPLLTLLFVLDFTHTSGQTCLTFTLQTGIWASELSWQITNESGTVVTDGFDVLGAGPWSDNTTYTGTACLPTGCYTLTLDDSYGDGWQGGTLTIATTDGVLLISNAAVPPSAFTASSPLPLDSSCPLPGCTLPDAANYDPLANLDDGSCTRQADNVTLLGHWTDTSLPLNGLNGRFSDVDAAVINGHEFAIIGSTLGTHFIDLETMTQVAYVPGAYGGSGVVHRDYHVDGNWVYAVCDQGNSTLQVMHLGGLASAGIVNVVYDSDALVRTAHNVFADGHRLYACAAKRLGLITPLLVLDVTEPWAPVEEQNLDQIIPSCHDLYVEADTAWVNATSAGTMVLDMTPASPTLIAQLDEYPFEGTNHSGWWDRSGDRYIFADENHGSPLKTVDTSDLTDLEVTGLFDSGTASDAIAHNLVLAGPYAYVSYYHDGLRIFDVSDLAAPVQVAYFDTYPPTGHSGFAGAWGVHVGLPSGRILISDVQSGLFVLRPDPELLPLCPSQPATWNGLTLASPGVTSVTIPDPDWGTDIVWAEFSLDEAACVLCLGDADMDCDVDVLDLNALLAEWGCTLSCTTDWDGNGLVSIGDLMAVLTVWGTNCCL